MSAFSSYASYYDLLNRGKDYTAEAGWVHALLRKWGAQTGTLLDVGCGTGRHAMAFAAQGWRVSGVDVAPAMVALARESAGDSGAQFSVGAAATFTLGRTFDAAVSLFHVVSYQAEPHEAEAMFRNVRRHLKPGGLFVFDFWHAGGVRADPPSIRVRRGEDGKVRVTRIAEPDHRAEESRVDVRYELFVEEIATGNIRRFIEHHALRYYQVSELTTLLQQSGFQLEATHAGLTSEPLSERAWYGSIVARAI